jgi:hypothetical protein
MIASFSSLLEKVIEKHGKPEAADAGYKTSAIAQYVFEHDMTPALPYTHHRTKDGYMKKQEYVYDEYYDCYICPQGQILKYATMTKNEKRQYLSNPLECQNCPCKRCLLFVAMNLKKMVSWTWKSSEMA